MLSKRATVPLDGISTIEYVSESPSTSVADNVMETDVSSGVAVL
jgi:hypothetical protein